MAKPRKTKVDKALQATTELIVTREVLSMVARGEGFPSTLSPVTMNNKLTAAGIHAGKLAMEGFFPDLGDDPAVVRNPSVRKAIIEAVQATIAKLRKK